MAQTVLYGVQRLTPTTDNSFFINYDANSRLDSSDEVRYLVDTSLQIPASPIDIYLPPTSAFKGILPIWIYVVDISGTAATRNIRIRTTGGDVINGTNLVTLATNDGALCINVAFNGYWYAASITGGGGGGGVQSVTGLDTDNTDPLNPVVQIAVDGVTITGDGTPANPLVASNNLVFGSTVTGAGTALNPYNAQLILGAYPIPPALTGVAGTMVVSPQGNDTTAVPYDMMRHYASIDAALTAAKDGDCIFVYAGNYIPAVNLAGKNVNYFFCEGTTVTASGTTLFDITNVSNVNVGGYANFIVASQFINLIRCQAGTGGVLNIQCRSIRGNTTLSSGALIGCFGQELVLDVIENISTGFRIIQCDNNPKVTINCDKMLLTGTYFAYNIVGASVIRCESSNPFTGTLKVKCNEMKAVNGNSTIMQLDCRAGGLIDISFGRIDTTIDTANITYAILLANIDTGVVILRGDIIAHSEAQNLVGNYSQNSGIYCLNLSLTQPQNIYYYGNFIMDEGYAWRSSSGTRFTFYGSVWGASTATQQPLAAPFPCLVYLTYDGGGAPTPSYTFLNSATFNQFGSPASCIWKDMFFGKTGAQDVNIYLECNDVKCWNTASNVNICATPPAVGSQNYAEMNGVIVNIGVDANITQRGVVAVINGGLTSIYVPMP